MYTKTNWAKIIIIIYLLINILLIPYIYSNDEKYNNDWGEINIYDDEFFDYLKNLPTKYGEYYEFKINKCRVTKEEKELMTIAEEYCNDDLFTTNTYNEKMEMPKILCNKVFEYYKDEFYKNQYTRKWSLMELTYNIDIQYKGEMLYNGVLYNDIYLVSLSLRFEYGNTGGSFSTTDAGSGCGFVKQRWIWIEKKTKKVIKFQDSSDHTFAYD